jgi:hypothetical protein
MTGEKLTMIGLLKHKLYICYCIIIGYMELFLHVTLKPKVQKSFLKRFRLMVSVMYTMIHKFLLEGKRSKKANW